MAKENKHSKGHAQPANRVQKFVPNNDNSNQQYLAISEPYKDYNRQLRQLMVLVKKAGIRFGDFSH